MKDLEVGRASWVIPKCDHSGPERGGRVDVTTAENVREVTVETETAEMCWEMKEGATDKEHRWPWEAAKGQARILRSGPPEETSPADAWTSAQ